MIASLCETTRPEGFELQCSITISLPTQCFFDVVLVAFPTWICIFTILTIINVVLWRRVTSLTARAVKLNKRRSRESWVLLGPTNANAVKSRPWIRNSINAAYYVLTAAEVGLDSVEVARFVKTGMGIGLTPFVYGGCLFAVVLRATKGLKSKFPGVAERVTVVLIGKRCSDAHTGDRGGADVEFSRREVRFARGGSVYTTMQQLTVQVVLLVVYLFLLTTGTVVQFLKSGYETALNKLRDTDTLGDGGVEMMAGFKA